MNDRLSGTKRAHTSLKISDEGKADIGGSFRGEKKGG